MYKVLIADDELPILEGLRAIIDWNALGVTVCAAVQDGETALARIEELQPDLVLMDLRMPGLDGMDAIEAARRHGYEGYFIILSGAADFSYAQRAIRSRTSYYLTKPIDEDELADAVKNIVTELDARNRRRTQAERHGKASLLFRLFTGISTAGPEELADYGLLADAYRVITCESYDPTLAQSTGHLLYLLQGLGVAVAADDITMVENREYALLRGRTTLQRFDAALQAARRSPVMPHDWNDAFAALGRVVSSPDEVVVSYCDATKLMQRRFFCPAGRHVADERDLPAEGSASPINAARYSKLLADCLQAQNEPLLRTLLDELKGNLTSNDRSVSAAKLLLGEIYVTVRQQIGYLYKNDMTAFSSESASVRQIDEAPSLHAALDFLARQFLAFSAQVHTNSADDVVTRVQRYIDRNCAQPLKLEELAPLFGYNASYLGKLFREKAQCSFNEYLDRARIEQAKAMLANGNKRVYEIAQELGYRDVDYFHKKFKKYVGVSPNEYRRTPAEPPKW